MKFTRLASPTATRTFLRATTCREPAAVDWYRMTSTRPAGTVRRKRPGDSGAMLPDGCVVHERSRRCRTGSRVSACKRRWVAAISVGLDPWISTIRTAADDSLAGVSRCIAGRSPDAGRALPSSLPRFTSRGDMLVTGGQQVDRRGGVGSGPDRGRLSCRWPDGFESNRSAVAETTTNSVHERLAFHRRNGMSFSR